MDLLFALPIVLLTVDIIIGVELVRRIRLPKQSWKLYLPLVACVAGLGFAWQTFDGSKYGLYSLIYIVLVPLGFYVYLAPPIRAGLLLKHICQNKKNGLETKPKLYTYFFFLVVASFPVLALIYSICSVVSSMVGSLISPTLTVLK
jgi:hypothetical protein